jgi:hypothetical protein
MTLPPPDASARKRARDDDVTVDLTEPFTSTVIHNAAADLTEHNQTAFNSTAFASSRAPAQAGAVAHVAAEVQTEGVVDDLSRMRWAINRGPDAIFSFKSPLTRAAARALALRDSPKRLKTGENSFISSPAPEGGGKVLFAAKRCLVVKYLRLMGEGGYPTTSRTTARPAAY